MACEVFPILQYFYKPNLIYFHIMLKEKEKVVMAEIGKPGCCSALLELAN